MVSYNVREQESRLPADPASVEEMIARFVFPVGVKRDYNGDMKTLAAKVGNSGARSGNRRVRRRQRRFSQYQRPNGNALANYSAPAAAADAPPSDATIITVTDPAGSGGSTPAT